MRHVLPLALIGSLGLFASACGGSFQSSSSGSSGFRVEQISVQEGAVWKINQPIDITFTEQVDFSTVNFSTIHVRNLLGEPATGSFRLLGDGRTVRFEPACPTVSDYSDSGLLPSSEYRLHVLGASGDGLSVLSTGGEGVTKSQSKTFHTPDSLDPLVLFLDTVAGPPAVRLRGRSGIALDEEAATHLELTTIDEDGTAVLERVFFRWDTDLQRGFLEDSPHLPQDPVSGAVEVPLNLYSRLETRISVVVHMDQPLSPVESNVTGERVHFEYEESPGSWRRLATSVELESNCTETGAALRLLPRGILPQEQALRVNLRQGLQDLTGDRTLLDSVQFALTETTLVDAPVAGAVDTSRMADGFLEDFDVGGSAPGSLEDTAAIFGDPYADWAEGGLLRASFDFGGSGGPGGDFSWVVPAGTTRILDSTTDSITGGPNGIPTTSQTIINGVVDVVDLTIEEGAALLVQGPNPLTILASGNVNIRGILSVSGTASTSVSTLNTSNQPEPGGSGQAGGGAGGTGSYLISQSTPRGGHGMGAFNLGETGGEGGETCYAPDFKDYRRGSGGGGGRFGPDVVHPYDPIGTPDLSEDPNLLCQTVIGLDAEAGFRGAPLGLGAESQTTRGFGGAIAPAPFFDENPHNDFLGTKIRSSVEFIGGEPVLQEELVIGELTQVLAGSGGGGGGDAVRNATFPLVPFLDTGDEKGAGGGGGAGGLRILATGDVILGPEGEIHADGGDGAGGENTGFFDRVGGGSGGGSGGHIVISTAGRLRIERDGAPASQGRTWYNDAEMGIRRRPITAVGGQSGAGEENWGGANELGGTTWFCDAIPFEAFRDLQSGALIEAPPIGMNCFQSLPGVDTGMGPVFEWEDPDNQTVTGAGGDGGPGVIQIHVNDATTDIVFPDGGVYGEGAAVTNWFAPPPHGWNSPAGIDVSGDSTTVNVPPDYMVPFFGRLSRSRSKWIPLGLARVNVGDANVAFQFTGTTGGFVDQEDDRVDLGTPLIGPLPPGIDEPPLILGEARTTLVLDASGLTGASEIYRRNPALLLRLGVRLERAGQPEVFSMFTVADAAYDSVLDRITLEMTGSEPLDLAGVGPEDQRISLLRRDYLVVTSSTPDVHPEETSIQIEFQATVADIDGEPSESAASPLTTDISDLNLDPDFPDDYVPWDFVRFRVSFDLNAGGLPDADLAGTPKPGLDFLRIPFGF